MFRIDRRFVKVTNPKLNIQKNDNDEVGARDEETDAAALTDTAQTTAEEMAEQYISEAEKEFEERVQALLDEAKQQAAGIIESANEEAELELKRAYDKGYAEGYKQGEADGKRAFDEALEQQREANDEALRNVLGEIERERERIAGEMEEDTVALAVEIVRKIIEPAEEELGNVFMSLIKNAMRQMSSDNKFVLRVSPAEYERFFPSGAAHIELGSGTVVTATVLRDVALEDGGLIIDTEDVTVNAGIDSQLKYVSLAFERANQYEPDGN